MSVRRFARDVPRSVRHAVRVAMEMVDDKGEVVGGMTALQVALGHDSPSTTRAAVLQAELWGYMRRTGPVGHGVRRVFVVVARLKSGACQTPGCDKVPGPGGRCLSCVAVERADRSWKHRAVEMCVAGMSPPAIAAHLKQSLFPDVVDALLAEGLLGAEWQARRREVVGKRTDTTRRDRVRRFRSKRAAESTIVVEGSRAEGVEGTVS